MSATGVHRGRMDCYSDSNLDHAETDAGAKSTPALHLRHVPAIRATAEHDRPPPGTLDEAMVHDDPGDPETSQTPAPDRAAPLG